MMDHNMWRSGEFLKSDLSIVDLVVNGDKYLIQYENGEQKELQMKSLNKDEQQQLIPETIQGIKLTDIDINILKHLIQSNGSDENFYVKLYSENKSLELGVEGDSENCIYLGSKDNIDLSKYRKWRINSFAGFRKMISNWDINSRFNLSLPEPDKSYGSLELINDNFMNFVVCQIELNN